MNRILDWLLTSVLLTMSLTAFAQDAEVDRKEPQAIAILERADEAIRNLHGVRYRAEYLGAYTSRGRMTAEVLLRRGSGADEVMGTISYAARIELTATDAPYAQEHYPARYTLVDTAEQTALIDPAARTVKRASGQDRYQLNWGGMGSAMLSQYVRPEPLKLEMEDSIAARYLGTTRVDGVENHIVWLKFDPISSGGLGEQLLYFGVQDHLIRKATLIMPRTPLPPRENAPEGAPEAFYPEMFIELAFADLQVLSEIPDSSFSVPEEEYRVILVDDKPTVGAQGPDWTLPLPGGDTISSEQLRGKVAVLFFWASWCPTCHRYMPEVQEIHDTYPDAVRVLAINAFDRDDAMAYIRDHGYTFDVALDGDDLLANQYRFVGQPAVVVLDREGVIRYRKLGPGDETIRPLIDTLVAQ